MRVGNWYRQSVKLDLTQNSAADCSFGLANITAANCGKNDEKIRGDGGETRLECTGKWNQELSVQIRITHYP